MVMPLMQFLVIGDVQISDFKYSWCNVKYFKELFAVVVALSVFVSLYMSVMALEANFCRDRSCHVSAQFIRLR